ncbi:MAG: TldD/PmbA family protein [Bacillales bacterium]|nr:TldD/PmbA family protein [Bacillales bacterium]
MLIQKEIMEEVIKKSASTGADFVEVFAEDTVSHQLTVIGGQVETAKESRIRGVGLRVALGADYVYGYTNNFDKESLLALASDLSATFSAPLKEIVPLNELKKGEHHKVKIYPKDVTNEMKKDIVMKAYNAAKAYSDEITQSVATYIDWTQKVEIAKMDGRFIEDERVYTRIAISAVASNGKESESGSDNPGMSMGFEVFDGIIDPEKSGKEAARQAIVNLHAKDCPSGEMPVIIDNGFGGVIFHEACGHALEATAVARGASVFAGKLHERIAHDCVSALDDGTIENAWGSENYDDEGNLQKKRLLIDKGILVSYMIDELNSRRMNLPCTSSGRRESYKYAPTSRMSNTYIAEGESTLEDMLKGIKFGLYAKNMGGGSVDPATGDFNFAVREGYLIRDGKIAEAVKGASLVGNGAVILKNIDMVGKNVDLGQGMCGSVSGSIPTNVGQPAIRVSKITVGGRSAK